MKWNNCSKEEAQEAYDYAKNRYQHAAESYLSDKKQYEACYSEYKSYSSKLDSVRSDTINFEKRIEQMDDVLKMLNSGGAVEDAANAANSSLKTAEEDLSKSLKHYSIPSPSISKTFECVPADRQLDSLSAIRVIEKEKRRLEQALADLKSKLRSMEQETDALTKKMNSLASGQADLSKKMKQYTFEMNHFKKYV